MHSYDVISKIFAHAHVRNITFLDIGLYLHLSDLLFSSKHLLNTKPGKILLFLDFPFELKYNFEVRSIDIIH